MHPKDADGLANSVDPEEQSDLGLYCLPRPICPKTLDHYGRNKVFFLRNNNPYSDLLNN